MTALDAIALGGWLLMVILAGLWLWGRVRRPY